ncbi:hypothetical protein ACJIZ3_008701 [Penstemon smallii]|uniref:Reverse transcriptase domain-containing protein n=1 Tax=Penstemon smallii TaxID=265156 RepID=A0ABD3TBS1_9LAMI
MSCLSWNCQGLGNPWTVRTLGEHIRETNPQLIFLMETKLNERKIEALKAKFDLFGVSVEVRGKSGGLALLWKKSVNFLLQSMSVNHIDVLVYGNNDNDPEGWRFTGFYGDPDPHKRKSSFDLLRTLASVSAKPWLCTGDFNAMTSHSEKEGGTKKPVWQLRDFQECLSDTGFCDLGFEGYPYTWCSRREYPNTTWERLDRACANKLWRQKFPSHKVRHMASRNSDHLPLHISFSTTARILQGGNRRNNFRFEAMWFTSEECERVIKDSWTGNINLANGNSVWDKLDNCRLGLLNWSKSSFGNVNKQICKLKKELHTLRTGRITPASKQKEKDVSRELELLLDKENMMWEQRAKAHWLKDGDRNTSFFHARATGRKERNEILDIRNAKGVWCESESEIENTVIDYFQNLFTSARPSDEVISTVLESVRVKVDQQANQSLLRQYSANEVTIAIKNMHPLKSPGPDGLSALFFQKSWKYIGPDIIECVLNFLNNRLLNPKCNYTHIVLIPKVENPESMTQFRPISLCNVIYKIASKTIVNRLKPIMNSVISEFQSAFVPSRQITDNVLVAYEIAEFMRHSKRSDISHMAIKLDMCKAYDKVEWPFLRAVMIKLGFDIHFVELIMLCISSVTYSCVLNGNQIGYIVPERGIRQGDPLSPFLFLFCAEALSSLFAMEEERGNISGVKICTGAPKVSHLLFADDTLVLCQANTGEALCIKNILDLYGKASGQDINFQKSSIVFSRHTKPEDIMRVQSVLPIRVEESHEKYLGLPLVIGRSKKEVFDFIRERFWNRIQGWNEKLLSRAGKEVLIKAVIQAIPSYVMSCFKLPKTFIRELESMISGFWWNDRGERKTHWVNWKTLCKSKKIGGLGFRNLEAFNTALLAKQAWRIITKPENLLSRILKAKYFPNEDFLDAQLGPRPSFTWRSIWGSKNLVAAGLRWRVGNGENIDIWKDPWIPRPTTFKISSPQNPLMQSTKVSSLIDDDLRIWNKDLIESIFWPEEATFILSIPLGSRINQDKQIWHYTNNGQFSGRSAHHLALQMAEQESTSTATQKDWKWIWSLRVPPKVKIFLWRFCHNALPTRMALSRRGVSIMDTLCPVCNTEDENLIHTFLHCSYARQFWAISDFPLYIYNSNATNAARWIDEVKSKIDNNNLGLFIISCWCIWWNRNQITWGKEGKVGPEAVDFAKSFFRNYGTIHSGAALEQNRERQSTRWSPPQNHIVKINFDAAHSGPRNISGIGGIARDLNGNCLGWFAEKKEGISTAILAEALAAKRAMELVQQQGWTDIILEGDCRNLIDTIAEPSPSLHDFGPIVEDIKRLGVLLSSFKACHILREGNKVAHFLAKSVSNLVDDQSIDLDVFRTLVIADSY